MHSLVGDAVAIMSGDVLVIWLFISAVRVLVSAVVVGHGKCCRHGGGGRGSHRHGHGTLSAGPILPF